MENADNTHFYRHTFVIDKNLIENYKINTKTLIKYDVRPIKFIIFNKF